MQAVCPSACLSLLSRPSPACLLRKFKPASREPRQISPVHGTTTACCCSLQARQHSTPNLTDASRFCAVFSRVESKVPSPSSDPACIHVLAHGPRRLGQPTLGLTSSPTLFLVILSAAFHLWVICSYVFSRITLFISVHLCIIISPSLSTAGRAEPAGQPNIGSNSAIHLRGSSVIYHHVHVHAHVGGPKNTGYCSTFDIQRGIDLSSSFCFCHDRSMCCCCCCMLRLAVRLVLGYHSSPLERALGTLNLIKFQNGGRRHSYYYQ